MRGIMKKAIENEEGTQSGRQSETARGVSIGEYKANAIRESGLRCMFTNIRSIMNNNKLDELRHELVEKQVDVLGIAESWTHPEVTDAEISLAGYDLFRRDRGNGRGGGVLLYVKNQIVATNISDKTKGLCETVWVSIRTEESDEVTIGVCYRCPSADQVYEENLLK
jgi:hypothetical protein